MNAGLRALVALTLITSAAHGQDVRLARRLDKPTFAAVNAIIDSARVAKLPTAPLVDRALEGAAKGSDGSKIIVAVQQLSLRMSSARRALGPRTTADEIKAAAGALDAGISPRDLARIRAASGKRPVTMSLAVVTDLIGRNVPVATATDLVVQMARAGAKDAELGIYQRNVRSDIDRGADPAIAARTRARGVVLRSTETVARPSE